MTFHENNINVFLFQHMKSFVALIWKGNNSFFLILEMKSRIQVIESKKINW